MSQTETIILLVGFVQLMVVGLGVWMLTTLVAILKVLSKIQAVLDSNEDDIKELKAFHSFADSKVKEMWRWFKNKDRHHSDNNLPPV